MLRLQTLNTERDKMRSYAQMMMLNHLVKRKKKVTIADAISSLEKFKRKHYERTVETRY